MCHRLGHSMSSIINVRTVQVGSGHCAPFLKTLCDFRSPQGHVPLVGLKGMSAGRAFAEVAICTWVVVLTLMMVGRILC